MAGGKPFWNILMKGRPYILMIDFPNLSYTSTREFHTLWYTWSTKKVPFSGGAVYSVGHYREYRSPRVVSGFGLSQLDLLAITFTENPLLTGWSPGSPAANAWHSYRPSFPHVLSSSSVIFRKCKVTKSFFNFFPPEKVYGVFQLLNKRSLTGCHSVREHSEPPFALFFLIQEETRGKEFQNSSLTRLFCLWFE